MIENSILRLPEVRDATGLSRSTIYAAVRNKRFPRPVKLGVRAVGWRASEISDWIESREACA